MANREKKRKGTGASGGGLAARIKSWETMTDRFVMVGPRTKRQMDSGYHYHQPGSQKKG